MFKGFSNWILKTLGWKIKVTTLPFPDKYIIIVIPHTSNWDFPLGLLCRSALGEKIRFIGKHSLFRPPFGALFRWMGGYPVDRSQSHNYVESVVAIFNKEKQLGIAIAPEGTRSKVDRLKTGFYYIAKSAGIPILMGKLDYQQRTLEISAPFFPTDDQEADFAFIYNYFRGARGKIPEKGFLYSS